MPLHCFFLCVFPKRRNDILDALAMTFSDTPMLLICHWPHSLPPLCCGESGRFGFTVFITCVILSLEAVLHCSQEGIPTPRAFVSLVSAKNQKTLGEESYPTSHSFDYPTYRSCHPPPLPKFRWKYSLVHPVSWECNPGPTPVGCWPHQGNFLAWFLLYTSPHAEFWWLYFSPSYGT